MDQQKLYSELFNNIMEEFPSAQISTVDVNNFNKNYKGLKISFDRNLFNPVFNLDEIEANIKTDEDLKNISEDIIKEIKENVLQSKINLDVFKDYETLKSHLCVNVIPIKGNEDLLKKIPYKPFNKDMAVIIEAVVSDSIDLDILPMIKINNNMLEKLEVEYATLYNDALKNSANINPPDITDISDYLMCEDYIQSSSTKKHDNSKVPVRFLTTQTGICGASVMLNKEIKIKAAEDLKGDYYLIPTSNFSLIVPANYPDSKYIAEKMMEGLIKSKNNYPIGELQYYDQETQTLEPNTEYEKRRNKDININTDYTEKYNKELSINQKTEKEEVERI